MSPHLGNNNNYRNVYAEHDRAVRRFNTADNFNVARGQFIYCRANMCIVGGTNKRDGYIPGDCRQ
ncbi:hypothetical protein PTE01_26110 [Pseudoalteromonas tetraodonis GFC]|uniref:Uncharacterized protein n=1 Tax=Pseudoalteromonas tetraodonis GFC TaxID=1315271 RepID=A0AA37S230_9GAMM|nr:hypothetical protein PTE01_26110 [Pseudoalteromonas tetraodonis GFC]GLQ02722.1 hypothetical protein GCM10007914_16030 [Pseudoalteromonas tetraodonis GFC]